MSPTVSLNSRKIYIQINIKLILRLYIFAYKDIEINPKYNNKYQI